MRRFLIPAAACAALLGLAVPAGAAPRQGTASETSCVAAAAMANYAACRKSFLSTRVTPDPAREIFEGQGAGRHEELCRGGLRRDGKMPVCHLGVALSRARVSMAIVGDSHAAHWRPALSRLARARGWHVQSVTSSGCDYSTEDFPRLDGAARAGCERFRREVPRWLARNPKITSVLFSQLPKSRRAEVAGYQEAWNRLPESVLRVGVIRDSPHPRPDARACVARAVARGQAPGPRCAIAQSRAVRPDAALRAAMEFPRPQTAAIDLTDLFCHDSRCYPVIGRTLVYADRSHQLGAFNRSLAPYLLEQLRRFWPEA